MTLSKEEHHRALSEAGKKGGAIGGKTTGPQKSWLLKLTPEERSAHMKKVRRGKKQDGEV